jgi:hypothetical protein
MQIKLKQGETFSLDGQYLDDDGVTPKSLTGVTLKSQIRFHGALVATLAVTILDANQGLYRLTAPNGTDSWPVSSLQWDIKESVDGVDKLTETHTISIEKAVTML